MPSATLILPSFSKIRLSSHSLIFACSHNEDEVLRLCESMLEYGRLLGVDTVTINRDARLACGQVQQLLVSKTLQTCSSLAHGCHYCCWPASQIHHHRAAQSTSELLTPAQVDAGLRMGLRIFVNATACTSPQSYFHTHYITQVCLDAASELLRGRVANVWHFPVIIMRAAAIGARAESQQLTVWCRADVPEHPGPDGHRLAQPFELCGDPQIRAIIIPAFHHQFLPFSPE